jgi:predicted DNA-binding transcriptional regulator AlpA
MHNQQAVVLPFNEDRVLTLSEFAINAGISLVTLRRLIARGEGPAVTKLSPRRLGVRVSHARAWLDSRISSGSKTVALDPA